MTARARTAIVLDTSCVRGTPRRALQALLDRGFQLHVSGLVLGELAVHLSRSPADERTSKANAVIRSRMALLSQLNGGIPRFAPTHSALVDKLGGTMVGNPKVRVIPYADWLSMTGTAWRHLESGDELPPDIEDFVRGLASYVEETGAEFVETVRAAAALGEPTVDELLLMDSLSKQYGGVLDLIRLPGALDVRDRFDAFSKMEDLHAKRAFGRLVGRYSAPEGNDAIDLNLLHHLAEGLIVVTRDYRLIEWVDNCGTKQAPWVRTVGELLAGRVPLGPPFAARARREASRHRGRRRSELSMLDQEVLAGTRSGM